ncbi:asparaginase [Chloracidobacterium validum]|uniref:Asparaginase n=1 Tax=Chloracidobacterium validum TaxID=2821543 RepID=A0ABX8BAF8_9BACT|nr:asparaginase domain-containing protein [Chloracidobacterium validum]QUW02623.1 asparaginase [Chloracidobacterium validum]
MSPTSSPVRILLTGGTLDKVYDERTGNLVFSRTHLFDMLDQARCYLVNITIEPVMLKDSLDMTEADRAAIRAAAQRSPETRLLITHGTDTMTETAHDLANHVTDKTVVFVGAMIPYSFGGSDALFNLGFALASARVLPPGVYVAMNGTVFDWHNVRKNRERGRFEPLHP